jgi:DNA-directed RNA polymerase beta subunit
MEESFEKLKSITASHVESYDYAMDVCLPKACLYMPPVEVKMPENSSFPSMNLWYEDFEWAIPEVDGEKMMPSECRMRNISYYTTLYAGNQWWNENCQGKLQEYFWWQKSDSKRAGNQ